MLWIEASLFTQTSMAGGSNDKEVTDVAVIACLSPSALAEIILTVEVTPRIAFI